MRLKGNIDHANKWHRVVGSALVFSISAFTWPRKRETKKEQGHLVSPSTMCGLSEYPANKHSYPLLIAKLV